MVSARRLGAKGRPASIGKQITLFETATGAREDVPDQYQDVPSKS
jgi:hypothetical protein